MAPKIRQTRGPGMNRGLKKPRFGKPSAAKPEDLKPVKSKGGSQEADAAQATSSYLSETLLAQKASRSKGPEKPRRVARPASKRGF